MGIKGLTKFLSDTAPQSIKQQTIDCLMGRTVAVDASMSLYQFMIAIRDSTTFEALANEAGEATSHISGMLSRVVKLLERGINPVYVFDGRPPELKSNVLSKRSQRKTEAEEGLDVAKEAGDKEEIKKFMGRTVKITKQHNDDVKALLRFIGVPYVEAPSEAEAQCAKLCADGFTYAVATEDADALTFGAPILIRHLAFSDSRGGKGGQQPLLVINLSVALEQLGLSFDEFIDFCILCGCDYCDTVKGIGVNTAYKMIKTHHTLENVISSFKNTKYTVPDDFEFQQAREIFKNPEVLQSCDVNLKFSEPDYDKLKSFLIDQHKFNANRVENYVVRLKKAKAKTQQTRLESFFGTTTVKKSTTKPELKVKAKSSLTRPKSASTAHSSRKSTSLMSAAAASQKRVKSAAK